VDAKDCLAYSDGYWKKIASLNDKRRYGGSVVMEITSGNSSQEMVLLIAGNADETGNLDNTDAFDGEVWISTTNSLF
jgi:hypothetical protein